MDESVYIKSYSALTANKTLNLSIEGFYAFINFSWKDWTLSMSVVQKKNLINFDMLGDGIETLDKATEAFINEINPSALADIYRKANNKNKAIQTLQNKLTSANKKIYSYEILSTYIYFEDYDGAVERATSLGFVDEPVERLLLLILIHKKLRGKNRNVICSSSISNEIILHTMDYLSKYFNIDIFEYFKVLLENFCKSNPKCTDKRCGASTIILFQNGCDRKYLSKLSLDSLKYIYDELGIVEALRLLVTMDPKIEESYFRKFVDKCSPSDEELISISERVYSPSLFNFLKHRDNLNDCIVELKSYYERESPNEIKFDSIYCKEIKNPENLLKILHKGESNSSGS